MLPWHDRGVAQGLLKGAPALKLNSEVLTDGAQPHPLVLCRWDETAMERAKQMYLSHFRSQSKSLERATADRIMQVRGCWQGWGLKGAGVGGPTVGLRPSRTLHKGAALAAAQPRPLFQPAARLAHALTHHAHKFTIPDCAWTCAGDDGA